MIYEIKMLRKFKIINDNKLIKITKIKIKINRKNKIYKIKKIMMLNKLKMILLIKEINNKFNKKVIQNI